MRTKAHFAKRDDGSQDRISDLNPELERVDVMAHKKTYHLADMLAQITSENLHPEWNTGPAQGKEEW